LTSGSNATDIAIYGSNTNSFILEKGQVVEIVLNSADPGKHPFHLHGHAFQAVARGNEDDGNYAYNATLPKVPMRRDTFMVRPNSNIVLRFKADNPGVWLFHCHIEWHIDSGLVATMIEAPLDLQASKLTIPPDHLAACAAQSSPTAGNAAGNTVNLFDLSGENLPPPPLPDGFTARGIVALVFSCISGFLGIAVITWFVYSPCIFLHRLTCIGTALEK
jgi:iron transport multicopper oxidase